MEAAAHTSVVQTGWLRSKTFDFTFVHGITAVALFSGALVVLKPDLFKWVLLADLWLLGYHHVVATFTRLAFDRASLREFRFIVFVLPLIVFATTFTVAWSVGVWVISSVYLYWQWFHYTRQSWGISRVYSGKSGGLVTESPLFSALCFYLVPTWGILYRSWQAPETFLSVELHVIPIPELLVDVVGFAAVMSLLVWSYRRFQAWRQGLLPLAHTLYMLSHFTIFIVGYIVIEDLTYGWLVINIWHNAQYVMFVWLFNTNRYKSGVDKKAPFLSEISQPQNVGRYLFVCLAISTMVYVTAAFATSQQMIASMPLAIFIYQTLNFHHYIVDSLIWKVRKPRMQKTMELSAA